MKMYGEQDAQSYVGKQLGNYRLIRILGRGSSAVVYLGEHQHLRMQAAIKVLHTHLLKNEIQSFEAEARTIAQLEHPNIVRVLEGGVEGNVPYLVMEYAPHGTLTQHYAQGQRYTPQIILPHVLQIAGALSYAHQRRIIHRDIKPENVLLGPRQEALLSDFGLAVVAHNTRSQKMEEAAGSLYYMAPEVIEGYPRPASDQYALAAMVYTWLNGAPPFVGTFREVASQHLSASPASLVQRVPGLTPQIEAVIQRALAKDPHQRFPDVMEFAKAFEAAGRDGSQAYDAGYRAHIEPPFPRQMPSAVASEETHLIGMTTQRPGNIPRRSPTRRTALSAIAATIVGMAAVGGGAWWIWGKATASTPQSVQPTATQTTKPTETQATKPTTTPARPFGTQLLVFKGHGIDPTGSGSNRISALAWSPNGKFLASADNTRVLVWEAEHGKIINEYKEHQEAVIKLGWLDNETIMSAGGEETNPANGPVSHSVKVWKAKDGTTTANYVSPAGTIPHIWSPDGKQILSVEMIFDEQGAETGIGSLKIWDASTGAVLINHQGQHLSALMGLAWSLDGTYIASMSSMGGGAGAPPTDLHIDVWESASGQNVLVDPEGMKEGICAGWQPEGKWVASGHNDGYVRIWEALTGKQVQMFRPGNGSVLALDWSSDGKRVGASIGSFQSRGYPTDISVWDTEQKKMLGTYTKHTDYARSLVWSPDGKCVASADFATVHIWQAV